MTSSFNPLIGSNVTPFQRVSLVSSLTNLTLDTDDGNSSLVVRSGSIPSLYIDKFANVGINTSSPMAQLEVVGARGECLRLRHSTSTTAYSNFIMSTNGNLSIDPNTAGASITTSASLSVSGSVSIQSETDASDSTRGGSLTVSGGLSVGKRAFIGSNLTVLGDLIVKGNSTTIDSTNVLIQDSTLILNSLPARIGQTGLMIKRFQNTNNSNQGNVIEDIPFVTSQVQSATPLSVSLTIGSTDNDFYKGWWAKADDQIRKIISYSQTTNTINVDESFIRVPSTGSDIQLFNRTYSTFVWDEGNKQFAAAFAAVDSPSNSFILDYANIKVSTLFANDIISNTLRLSNVLDSSSPITGSMILSGGIGIAKSIHVGDGIHGIIKTSNQPHITSLGSLSSLVLENTSPSGIISQVYKSNLYNLSIGIRGNTNSINPGLAFIEYNSNESILLNPNGNVAFGTRDFTHRLNIGGGVNASEYYLNGVLLQLDSLRHINLSVPGTAISSSALVLDNQKTITGISSIQSLSFIVGTKILTEEEVGYLTGIDIGVAVHSKALILNEAKDISGINTLSANNIILGGINVLNSISSSVFVTDITPGIASKSKALVLNEDKSISGITSLSVGSITVNGNVISNELTLISGITNGEASHSKALVLNQTKSVSGIVSLSTDSIIINSFNISSEASFLSGASLGNAINSKVLVLNSAGHVNGITLIGTASLSLGGITLNAAEATYLSSITTGMATAGKALVFDQFKSITGINSLTTNTLVLGLTSLTITEADYIAGNQPGTAKAGKALIVDLQKRITGIQSLQTTQLIVGATTLNESEVSYLTSNTPGIAISNKALLPNSNLSIAGLNAISFTGSIYNASSDARGRYIGAWDTSNTYWGIGFDGSTNTIRIGVCSDTQGTWSNEYANVLAGKFSSVSDYRLKEDVKSIHYGLDTLLKLNPVSYKMKYTKKVELGFIAHEVQEHIPEVVEGEKDKTIDNINSYQSINYTSLIPVLIKAIQEQNKRIQELERLMNISNAHY